MRGSPHHQGKPVSVSKFVRSVREKQKRAVETATGNRPCDVDIVAHGRCKNCGKRIGLTKKNKDQKKFCGLSDPGKGRCKDEYHQNGSTPFGPLKERVTRLTVALVDERLAQLLASPVFAEELERMGFLKSTKVYPVPKELRKKSSESID